ncbi:MAG: hypothetical protein GF365_03615 [Candidatus Buchananbacteria bacterium]|nr:hypothetical protein [Candidatus Buchananbacteria bacterium]
MKKILSIYILYLIILVGILMCTNLIDAKILPDYDNDGLADQEEEKVYNTDRNNPDTDQDGYPDSLEIFHGYSPVQNNAARLNKVTLNIPYINESPDGSWTGPWKNGCEEASIAMIENFYLGNETVAIKDSMDFMMTLFNKQDQIWGSNADADAYRTAKLIDDYTNYNAIIIDNPTIASIKKELNQKRPVISFHYGKELQNPNIPFLATGSYYHVIVLIGYDDTTGEFIAHDNGDIKTGEKHRYNYDVLMNSLNDFVFETRQANGTPRVIFTYPKLVKLTNSPHVYYLKDNDKQWIVNEQTFNAQGFDWAAINVVRQEWLDNFTEDADIK